MLTQLRKNIEAAHTYTNTVKGRERRKKRLNINTTALAKAMWLFGSSFLPLRLDFSAGRRVYERAREI